MDFSADSCKNGLKLLGATMLKLSLSLLVAVTLQYAVPACAADLTRGPEATRSRLPVVSNYPSLGCRPTRGCAKFCPDRYSCYPLYGAYGPYGGPRYWSAYTEGGWAYY